MSEKTINPVADVLRLYDIAVDKTKHESIRAMAYQELELLQKKIEDIEIKMRSMEEFEYNDEASEWARYYLCKKEDVYTLDPTFFNWIARFKFVDTQFVLEKWNELSVEQKEAFIQKAVSYIK